MDLILKDKKANQLLALGEKIPNGKLISFDDNIPHLKTKVEMQKKCASASDPTELDEQLHTFLSVVERENKFYFAWKIRGYVNELSKV